MTIHALQVPPRPNKLLQHEAQSGTSRASCPAERLGRWGLTLGFLWGFSEGTFFFIIPDVLISIVAVFSPRQGRKQVLSVLLGAMTAGAFLFAVARAAPVPTRTVVARVPFIPANMFRVAQQDLDAEGVWGMVRGTQRGIPYKVYVTLAADRASWIDFLRASMRARLGRFVVLWGIGSLLGLVLRRLITAYPRTSGVVVVGLWGLIYLWYWTCVVARFTV
jgi:hypothetical protein